MDFEFVLSDCATEFLSDRGGIKVIREIGDEKNIILYFSCGIA